MSLGQVAEVVALPLLPSALLGTVLLLGTVRSRGKLRRRLQRLAGAAFGLPRHLPLLADDEVAWP